MDDARDESGSDEAIGGQAEEDGQVRSDALELATSTTLVEVMPGVAVVFGEVPDGLELISLDMVPSFDRAELSTALGSLGNAGTIVGNVAEAVSSAQGLFRVNDATLSLLKSGGQMAAKDGAKLGAIFKNGELVAQARFIPASMTAATAIAAIGPAVAMIALQMQLGEISGLVRSNIQLTTQTLKAIRNEQWAELEGLAESVDESVKETPRTRRHHRLCLGAHRSQRPQHPQATEAVPQERGRPRPGAREGGGSRPPPVPRIQRRGNRLRYLRAAQLAEDPRGVPGCPGCPRQNTKRK